MGYIRLRKVLRDIGQDKGRTVIVLTAVFLGVFAVAMMTTSYLLLKKNLHTNYIKTNPASLIVVSDRADAALLDYLKQMPDIEDAETRDCILARFQTGPDSYVPVLLFSVAGFDGVRINKFSLKKGYFPGMTDEIVVEQTAQKLTPVDEGNDYMVVVPGSGTRKVHISGMVHDPGMAPSWMEGVLYGYTKETFSSSPHFKGSRHTIFLTVKDHKFDEDYIKDVTVRVVNMLKKEGVHVYQAQVPKPGRHIHQGQMDSLMFLLVIFGILTLVLSCSLVVNMVSAIMAREIRQIGIMKAIGATTGKIASLYLSMILAIAAGAAIFATPLGMIAGESYAEFVASMLNFTLIDRSAGIFTVFAVFFTGILLPCLVAVYPVFRKSSVSIYEALNDYGVTSKGTSEARQCFALHLPRIIRSRVFLLSLRNTFRRRSRLVLTLLTLILGGAIFITTFNIRQSMTGTLLDKFDNQKYDLAIVFSAPHPFGIIRQTLSTVKGIRDIECWDTLKTVRVMDRGLESGQFDLRALPASSQLVSPEIIAGSWIAQGDDGVVINHILGQEQPDLTVGKKAHFLVNGKVIIVTVKGIIREVFTPPAAYMDYDYYISRGGIVNSTGRLALVDIEGDSADEVARAIRELEHKAAEKAMDIITINNKLDYRDRIVDHFLVITTMLIMMTFLVIVVGGLGIVTTMSINVAERRRELGVLKTLGATNGVIYKLLGCEGFISGAISWVCSVVLSIPLSYWLGNVFFDIFFKTTINFRMDPIGIVAGFFINLVFGTAAVLIPARNTLKIPVAGQLAYE